MLWRWLTSILVMVSSLAFCQVAPQFTAPTLTVAAEQPQAYLAKLRGQRVGLVVNQTSRAFGVHLVDYLLSQDITIAAVFAPEHGFRGQLGAGEKVQDGTDPSTGIAIRSLYGNNKKPSAKMLSDIDVLVFDIQDVGARFYTYISTLHYVLEAAAESDIKVIVLDRPNPHGGSVAGPMREAAMQSFVGMDPLPLLHGLTVGELALMIKGEGWIAQAQQLTLDVVKVNHYTKRQRYDLPLAPSPNLPNPAAIRLYPSLCLFEATTVSVGRGTPWPFQVIGHHKVALGNLHFTPVAMANSAPTPKLEGQLLCGIALQDSSITGFDISLLHSVYHKFKQAGEPFIDRPKFFDLLSGTSSLRAQLDAGLSVKEIEASWQDELSAFEQRRQPYLLYRL